MQKKTLLFFVFHQLSWLAFSQPGDDNPCDYVKKSFFSSKIDYQNISLEERKERVTAVASACGQAVENYDSQKDLDILLAAEPEEVKWKYFQFQLTNLEDFQQNIQHYWAYWAVEEGSHLSKSYEITTRCVNICNYHKKYEAALEVMDASTKRYPDLKRSLLDQRLETYTLAKNHAQAMNYLDEYVKDSSATIHQFSAWINYNLLYIKDLKKIKTDIHYTIAQRERILGYKFAPFCLKLIYAEYSLGNKATAFEYMKYFTEYLDFRHYLFEECDFSLPCMMNDFYNSYPDSAYTYLIFPTYFLQHHTNCYYKQDSCIPSFLADKGFLGSSHKEALFEASLNEITKSEKIQGVTYLTLSLRAKLYEQLKNYDLAAVYYTQAAYIQTQQKQNIPIPPFVWKE